MFYAGRMFGYFGDGATLWRLRRAAQQAEQHAAASAAADEAQLLPHTPAPHPAELARHMTDPSITIPYES